MLYNDFDLEYRFRSRFGKFYKYIKGIFLKYEDGVYKINAETELCKDIYDTLYLAMLEDVPKEDLKSDLSFTFNRFFKKFDKNPISVIRRVKKSLEWSLKLESKLSDFDRGKENILNLENGYFNLDENILYQHSPDKLFLNKINVEYKKEESPSNDWNDFLMSIFNGDKEKIRYLQKAMGYTFSSEHNQYSAFVLMGNIQTINLFIDLIKNCYSEIMIINRFDYKKISYWHDPETSRDIKKYLSNAEYKKMFDLKRKKCLFVLGGLNDGVIKFMNRNMFFKFNDHLKFWIIQHQCNETKMFGIQTKYKLINIGFSCAQIQDNVRNLLSEKHNKEAILKWIIDGYYIYKKEGLEIVSDIKIIDEGDWF